MQALTISFSWGFNYAQVTLNSKIAFLWHTGSSMEEEFEEVAGGICLQVYRETLRGVVTACRRYKDELLEACLQLVLSAPTLVMTIHVKPQKTP